MESSTQPWPSELNYARQGQGLELKDKYTVRYVGDARHLNDVGAIQSNHPVPANATVFYYELCVLDQGVGGKIAIGFADKNFKLTRQPGWEVGSYGYHGDDGKKFIGSGIGEEYGPTFGTGDVVGAGIHLGRQELFFTKNGTRLKVAHRPVRAGLYPTIGLHSKGEMVQVNFGQKPWAFDLEGMLAEERAAQRAAIDRIPVSPGTTHRLVREYLLHYGYAETLAAFDEAAGTGQEQEGTAAASSGGSATAGAGEPSASTSGRAGGVAAATLALRADLRRALQAGDVDSVLEALQRSSPAVLSDAARYGDVHFQLACQKFIELVRRGQVHEAVAFAQGSLAPLRGQSAAALETSLRDVVALVAYQRPEASPLAHLLGQAQREAVADAVNAAVLAAAAGGGGAGAEGAASMERGDDASPTEGPTGVAADAAALLRPSLAVTASTAVERPVSRVEALLQQLVAVQGTLHEANGGQGGAFNLREHMVGPAT